MHLGVAKVGLLRLAKPVGDFFWQKQKT